MGRPGIMLYFDILEPIRMLPDADKGRLLVAMLEYGRDGKKPELDGALGIAWSFVQPRIDKDAERYDETKIQREYAVFCKKRKRIYMPKILFEDWIVMTDDERKRAVDPVLSRKPTNNVQSTEDNVQSTEDNVQSTEDNVQSTEDNVQSQLQLSNYSLHRSTDTPQLCGGEGGDFRDGPAAENGRLKVMDGKLGQGVVFLSEQQIEDLLDVIGIDAFDKYVDKLARFIIKNDANVADHYGTILKWWRQDCGLTPR